MIEYTTGLTTEKVLADLNTLYEDNPLDIDGTAMLRLNGSVRGLVRASQIATAEENALQIAVYGKKGGLRWEQENPIISTICRRVAFSKCSNLVMNITATLPNSARKWRPATRKGYLTLWPTSIQEQHGLSKEKHTWMVPILPFGMV